MGPGYKSGAQDHALIVSRKPEDAPSLYPGADRFRWRRQAAAWVSKSNAAQMLVTRLATRMQLPSPTYSMQPVILLTRRSLWYSNLAGARQGRGGGETVRKPEGLGKDPREGCLYLRKKGTR